MHFIRRLGNLFSHFLQLKHNLVCALCINQLGIALTYLAHSFSSFVVCRATTHNVIKCCETDFPPLPAKRSEVNVAHAFYDRPHPQGSTIYLSMCVRVCVCVRETDRRPHKSSCKWPEPNLPGLAWLRLSWSGALFLFCISRS